MRWGSCDDDDDVVEADDDETQYYNASITHITNAFLCAFCYLVMLLWYLVIVFG